MKSRKVISFILAAVLTVTGTMQINAENRNDVVSPYEQGEEIVLSDVSSTLPESEYICEGELPSVQDAEEELGDPVLRYVTELPDGEEIIDGIKSGEEAVGGGVLKSGVYSNPKPTQYEIAEMAKTVTSASERFSTVPGTKVPYSTGALTEEYLQSALTYVNYIRYIAGLDSLTLNENCCNSAQYGAVLLAAGNSLSHSPSKPSDMEDDFYEKGLAGTSSSNIYSIGANGSPALTLRKSIEAYMRDDSSVTNLLKMGHRRWVLYPHNVRVGFGQADSATKYFASMKVMSWEGDGLGKSDDPDSYESVDYDFISWPSSGNFPSDLISLNVPWTVTVNPEQYAKPDADKVTVSVTRVEDGKNWTFSQADITKTPGKTKKYMNIDTGGYGVSNCITFNLGTEFDRDRYDGVYEIAVSGLKDKKGNDASIVYRTEFFDINNPGKSVLEEGEEEYNPDPGKDVIEDDSRTEYEVSYYTGLDGETLYHSVKVTRGNTVELPENPEPPLEGYEFDGWFTEKSGEGNLFNEMTAVTEDVSVYAYFKEIPEETQGIVKTVEGLTIGKIKNQVYCGEKILPDFTVKDGNILLSENTDYTLRYRENENVGTATVLIEGKNGYSGTKTATFEILPKSIAKADIWLEDQTATGRAVSLKIHAMDVQGKLLENKDYRITQTKGNLTAKGKVTVTFEGIGNYTGKTTKTFTIHDRTVSLAEADMIAFDTANDPAYDTSAGGYVYNGKAIRPKVIVTDLNGNVISEKNYKVKYKNNKNAGLASITITGKKSFKGSYTVYFRILKRSVEELADFKIGTKTFTGSLIKPVPSMRMPVRVNGALKTLKLKNKRDVSLFYSKNSKVGIATITVTGRKNFSGTKKIDFAIGEQDIGKGVKIKAVKGVDGVPEITLTYKKYTLKEGSDYTYQITESEKEGKKHIEITGKGNFKGSLSKDIVVK